MEDVARARRGLVIYLAVVVAGSAALEFLLWSTHEPIGKHAGLILLLMWTPALASVVARWALREGIRDVSFRFGGRAGRRALAVAWLFPVAVGLIAYGLAWSAGLATWAPPGLEWLGAIESPAIRFVAHLAFVVAVGPLVGTLSAAGEEIGWRGYMLTRLIEARIPHPVLVSGAIWASWHLPLILSGQYAAGPYPVLSAVVFFLLVLAIGYFVAYLRLTSGSVWPAVIAHASWNALIQGVFDASTRGAGIWLGESGIVVAIVAASLVLVHVRGTWTIKRYPADEHAPTVRATEM